MNTSLVAFWIIFLGVMFLRRRLTNEQVSHRAPGTWLGIAIQAVGFSAIWTYQKQPSGLLPLVEWLSGLLGLLGAAGARRDARDPAA